jgi:DNA-binding NarL/FixJ family response regulator
MHALLDTFLNVARLTQRLLGVTMKHMPKILNAGVLVLLVFMSMVVLLSAASARVVAAA